MRRRRHIRSERRRTRACAQFTTRSAAVRVVVRRAAGCAAGWWELHAVAPSGEVLADLSHQPPSAELLPLYAHPAPARSLSPPPPDPGSSWLELARLRWVGLSPLPQRARSPAAHRMRPRSARAFSQAAERQLPPRGQLFAAAPIARRGQRARAGAHARRWRLGPTAAVYGGGSATSVVALFAAHRSSLRGSLDVARRTCRARQRARLAGVARRRAWCATCGSDVLAGSGGGRRREREVAVWFVGHRGDGGWRGNFGNVSCGRSCILACSWEGLPRDHRPPAAHRALALTPLRGGAGCRDPLFAGPLVRRTVGVRLYNPLM
jgi:hypothetical protein